MELKSGLSVARSAETVARNVAKQQVCCLLVWDLQTGPVIMSGIGFVTQHDSWPWIYGPGKLMVDDKRF